MASTGSQEDLFKKEISKYNPICEDIGQNIEAQEQLLFQIQVSCWPAAIPNPDAVRIVPLSCS